MSSTSPTAVVHSQNVGHDTITPASQSSETGQFLSRMSGGDEKIVTEGDATIKKNDWPLQGIKDPHENDVLFGRGGKIWRFFLPSNASLLSSYAQSYTLVCKIIRWYKSSSGEQKIQKDG